MKNIQADIKSGNFKQVYLLYGEEAYLKQQYKQNLVKALNPDGDTMNFNHYEGKGIDVKQLIDLCEIHAIFLQSAELFCWKIQVFSKISVRNWQII